MFGAYSRCSWPSADGVVADPTGKSFLFSLVNAANKAARFSLRVTDHALELSVHGLLFGAADLQAGGRPTGMPSFVLMLDGRPADQTEANVANDPNDRNAAYQPDDGQVCDALFSPVSSSSPRRRSRCFVCEGRRSSSDGQQPGWFRRGAICFLFHFIPFLCQHEERSARSAQFARAVHLAAVVTQRLRSPR